MKKIILIIGVWRSGTSLLRDIVKLHPKVDGPSFEPHYIRQSMQKYGWNQFKQPDAVIKFIQNHQKFKVSEFDHSQLYKVNNIDTVAFWDCFFNSYKSDKPWIVIKDPRTLLHLDHTMKILKPEKVILIKRDPRAVYASQKKLWPKKNLFHTSFFWNSMKRVENKYDKQPYFHKLYYEDLMKNPNQEIKKTFDFISNEYNIELLKSELPELNAKRVDQWKDKLNQEEIEHLQSLCIWDKRYLKIGDASISFPQLFRYYKSVSLKPDLLLDKKPLPFLALPKHFWYKYFSKRF